jgi:hypothetical protein
LLSLGSASYSFGQDIKATPVASTSEGITATTNCKAWKPGELMADEKCEILKGQFLRAQNKTLGNQLAREKDNAACMQQVKPLVEQGKVTREMLVKFGQDRMCDLLNSARPSG